MRSKSERITDSPPYFSDCANSGNFEYTRSGRSYKPLFRAPSLRPYSRQMRANPLQITGGHAYPLGWPLIFGLIGQIRLFIL